MVLHLTWNNVVYLDLTDQSEASPSTTVSRHPALESEGRRESETKQKRNKFHALYCSIQKNLHEFLTQVDLCAQQSFCNFIAGVSSHVNRRNFNSKRCSSKRPLAKRRATHPTKRMSPPASAPPCVVQLESCPRRP